MAEFVFGLGSEKKSEYLLEKMKAATECGRRVILIVPEQQALDWDRRCAKLLPPSAALLCETVSFTRLADNVFRRFGGCCKNYITDAKKTLIMWNAVVSVAPQLKVFSRLDREDRYVPLLLSAVREMKLYSVTPSQLEAAATDIGQSGGSSFLTERLCDISLIYAAYDEMLHSCYDDPEELPDALCAALREHNYFDNASVFIDSFYTMTPKEMNILTEIFRRTGDVTITFAITKETAGARADSPHTNHIRDYAREAARIASRCNREISVNELCDEVYPEFDAIRRSLWDYTAEPVRTDSDRIVTLSCADKYDEARVCAAMILDKAANGCDFSEIAVCAADISSRRGIINSALTEAGIPYYISEKNSVTSYPAVRLLLCAAAVCAGGWQRDDVISFAKTGLCPITPNESDAFDKYTAKWRIRGKKQFCRDGGWDMNPDGYVPEDAASERGLELLRLANSAKEAVIPSLEAFSESVPGKLIDICSAAYKLLCDFRVAEKLEKKADSLLSEGKAAEAQKTRQVWDAVCDILDTMVEALPDATVDAPRFASLLRRTADTCTVGSIPDGIDRVVVGNAGQLRLSGIKHMIMLGCVAGEFPASPKDDGFFSDSDKKTLSELGIKLSSSAEARLGEELFRFMTAAAAPSQSLTLISPLEGGASPSPGVTRLLSLLPDSKKQDFSDRAHSAALWDWAYARASHISGKSAARLNASLSAADERLKGETADKLFGSVLPMTHSRLEAFNDCPFFYYCRYVLRLDEGQTASITPADVGNFVHKILEEYMKESSPEGFPTDDGVLVSRSDRLIRDYIASVCPHDMPGRIDYLFSRLTRSVRLFARSLNEEFSQSDFVPYSFELPVGFDDSLPAPEIPLSDGRRVMTMRGIIDRLDILRRGSKIYVRVADYKTGAKSFNLAEVEAGRNVQLLLYLFSVCSSPVGCSFRSSVAPDGEELLPAGAVYFSARPGEAKSSSLTDENDAYSLALSGISRQGLILSDKDIISAMEHDTGGKYIPVALKKDGDFTKNSSLADSERFEEISKKLRASLSGIADSIVSGRACAEPSLHGSASPCTHCAMKAVCRFSGAGTTKQEDDK